MSHAIAQLASIDQMTPGQLILGVGLSALVIIVAAIYDSANDSVVPPDPPPDLNPKPPELW